MEKVILSQVILLADVCLDISHSLTVESIFVKLNVKWESARENQEELVFLKTALFYCSFKLKCYWSSEGLVCCLTIWNKISGTRVEGWYHLDTLLWKMWGMCATKAQNIDTAVNNHSQLLIHLPVIFSISRPGAADADFSLTPSCSITLLSPPPCV